MSVKWRFRTLNWHIVHISLEWMLDKQVFWIATVTLYLRGGPGSIPGTTRKKSSGSVTGSAQPREYNWGAAWKKSSGSCLENREYGRRNPSRWPRGTLYPQKLAITSPTRGDRSVDVVCSRMKTTEFSLVLWLAEELQVQVRLWPWGQFVTGPFIVSVTQLFREPVIFVSWPPASRITGTWTRCEPSDDSDDSATGCSRTLLCFIFIIWLLLTKAINCFRCQLKSLTSTELTRRAHVAPAVYVEGQSSRHNSIQRMLLCFQLCRYYVPGLS
jgi:hypothetical protein